MSEVRRMMTRQKNKISIPMLLFLGAIEFILFIFAIPFIFKLIGTTARTPIHDILNGNEFISAFAFFAWIVSCFALVGYVIIYSAGSAQSHYGWTTFIKNILENLKITFTEKSNFFGTTYEGEYLGLKTACRHHTGDENSADFINIQIQHPRKLNLGIVIRNKGGVSLLSNEGKDIFAKTIKPADASLNNVDIFTRKKEEVENMLYSAKITEPLRKLTAILPNLGIKSGAHNMFVGGLSGFYLNDNYVSVRIEESLIKKENEKYVEDMFLAAADLSRAVSESAPLI